MSRVEIPTALLDDNELRLHVVPVVWKWVVSLTVSCLIGVCIGIVIAPRPLPPVEVFVCSVEHGTDYPPCPPVDKRVVWATWEGGVTAPASWTGRDWLFVTPVLGMVRTSETAVAWSEL